MTAARPKAPAGSGWPRQLARLIALVLLCAVALQLTFALRILLMTGVDPEGADLRRGGEVARLDFDRRATTAEAARVELVRLVKRARAA